MSSCSNSSISFNGSYKKTGFEKSTSVLPERCGASSAFPSTSMGMDFRGSSSSGCHTPLVPPTPAVPTTPSAIAGYGGSVTTPAPVPVVIVPSVGCTGHFNQGIGNGIEFGDPGNSRPHGSSNDEYGRQPAGGGCQNLFR
jgi:hypothetical protein